MATSRHVIINADDYGYSQERDAGILECYRGNSISSVSLMVNGCHAEEAVIKAEAAGLPMGLHLNLTEGSPVNEQACTTLVDSDGFMLGKLGFRAAVASGSINTAEMKREIESQIEKFKKLTGHVPVHVDGHQHVHVVPGVCEIFASVLKDKGITVTRLPLEKNHQIQRPTPKTAEFMKELQSHAQKAQDVFMQHDIRFPGFTGLYTMGSYMTLDSLQAGIQNALENQSKNYMCNNNSSTPSGSEQSWKPRTNWKSSEIFVELMAHPGYRTGQHGGCGNGPDSFAQSSEREHEMKILNHPKMKNFYEENKIEIMSFRDLIQRQCIN